MFPYRTRITFKPHKSTLFRTKSFRKRQDQINLCQPLDASSASLEHPLRSVIRISSGQIAIKLVISDTCSDASVSITELD